MALGFKGWGFVELEFEGLGLQGLGSRQDVRADVRGRIRCIPTRSPCMLVYLSFLANHKRGGADFFCYLSGPTFMFCTAGLGGVVVKRRPNPMQHLRL